MLSEARMLVAHSCLEGLNVLRGNAMSCSGVSRACFSTLMPFFGKLKGMHKCLRQ